MIINLSLVIHVGLCAYVQSRSSWLRLQGDPGLPSREAIGTRTAGKKSLKILTLIIRGHIYPPLVGAGTGVCLTQKQICTDKLIHSQGAFLCKMFWLPLTANLRCDTVHSEKDVMLLIFAKRMTAADKDRLIAFSCFTCVCYHEVCH